LAQQSLSTTPQLCYITQQLLTVTYNIQSNIAVFPLSHLYISLQATSPELLSYPKPVNERCAANCEKGN